MKSQIQLLLTLQLAMTLAYLLAVWLLGIGDVFSALTGCLASLLPSVYFSMRMLRQVGDNDAAAWLSHAYRSDIGKWVMAAIIFAMAFTSGYQWDPLILFVGYLIVQLSGMFVPLFDKGN